MDRTFLLSKLWQCGECGRRIQPHAKGMHIARHLTSGLWAVRVDDMTKREETAR